MLACAAIMNPAHSDQANCLRCHRCLASLAVVLVIFGISLALSSQASAGFTAAPDSTRVVALQLALRNLGDVRIGMDSTLVAVHGVTVSSEGVRFQVRGSVSHISTPLPSQDHQVPWAEIESIRARKGRSGIGPHVGAAIGLAIGLTIAISQGESIQGTPIVGGLVAGIVFGRLVDRPGPWQTVYP
jgi:hypothetical protein